MVKYDVKPRREYLMDLIFISSAVLFPSNGKNAVPGALQTPGQVAYLGSLLKGHKYCGTTDSLRGYCWGVLYAHSA